MIKIILSKAGNYTEIFLAFQIVTTVAILIIWLINARIDLNVYITPFYNYMIDLNQHNIDLKFPYLLNLLTPVITLMLIRSNLHPSQLRHRNHLLINRILPLTKNRDRLINHFHPKSIIDLKMSPSIFLRQILINFYRISLKLSKS